MTDLTPVVAPLTRADLLVQSLVARRPKDGELTTAEAIWGDAADFQIVSGDGVDPTTTNPAVVLYPDKPTMETVAPIATIVFEEVKNYRASPGDFALQPGRRTTKVRIENPDDSSQYVIVERIDEIVFKAVDLRPKETLTGTSVYPDTVAGQVQKVLDSFAKAVGGAADSAFSGAPNAQRPPFALYRFILHNPAVGTVVP